MNDQPQQPDEPGFPAVQQPGQAVQAAPPSSPTQPVDPASFGPADTVPAAGSSSAPYPPLQVTNIEQPTPNSYVPPVSNQAVPPADPFAPDQVASSYPSATEGTQQPVQATTSSSKSKLPLLVGIILVILLLVGGGVHYALDSSRPKSVTTTQMVTGHGSSSDGSASVTTPVTTTVSCGSENCFAQYFKSCTPATLSATSDAGSVKYQIYGKKGSGCSMLFEYTSNPFNSAWANKPMTCNFDNSKTLDNSVSAVITDLSSHKNTYDCTGPLVAILQNL